MDVLSPGLSNSIPFRLRRGRDPDPSKRSWFLELLMRLDRGTGHDGKPGESAESVVTRKALLLGFTAATIVLGIGLLVIATVAVPIFPTIASPALDGTALAGTTGGVLLWTVFGLLGSVRTVDTADGAGHFTFHLPFVGAAMILGGPTAGAWVAFLGTFDRRELQSQPWYGVLANHASIAIAAVAGGITYAWLAAALQSATGDVGMARFVAILAAGVVLEAVANALAITTIKIRDDMGWSSVIAIVIDDFRRETLLEIALVWILVIGSITVGWWAPLVIGLAVVGYLATYRESGMDDPTGLLKKRAFLAKVDRKVGWMRLGARGGTMLFFDIDRFSRFNNSAGGYEAGDEIIEVVAARMKELFRREGDILGRLMGDEFAVFFVGMVDSTVARQRALELIEAMERPIALGDRIESITISVGILIAEGHGIATWSASAMLERAVVAEKHAKVDRTHNPHLWLTADGTSFEYVAAHKGHTPAE